MNVKNFRVLAFALLLIFALSVAGCGNSEAGAGEQKSAESTESTTEPAAQPEENEPEEKELEYPTRAIEVVSAGGPGGGTDTFARAVSRSLSDELGGVTINVINKVGGGGSIASAYVANQPADGYTLLPTNSDFQINMATGKMPNYVAEGVFTPLALIHTDYYTIMAKSGRFENIDDIVSEAKKNPGEITIAGTTTRGIEQFTVMRLEKAAGIDLNYIPFEDISKSHPEVLGGHIDLLLSQIGPVLSMLEGDKLEMHLVYKKDRLDDYPDVPTTVEKGWDLTIGMDRGFIIHADTPEPIKKKLEAALKKAIHTPEYEKFAKQVKYKYTWMGIEEYTEYFKKEIAAYKELVEQLDK